MKRWKLNPKWKKAKPFLLINKNSYKLLNVGPKPIKVPLKPSHD